MSKVKVEFPGKLTPLFQPHRYKILVGGRGSSKSWSIARALLILGARQPLRILCARELQKSIKDSVHKLLSDQVAEMHLDGHYEILQTAIRGKNGTEFFFESLRHNASQIKSYERINIVWVEEAATVSKSSWDVLIPTIRAEGSEIWVSFNPELEEDETYQRFILNPPSDSVIIKLNWSDNPWFPDVLKSERDDLNARDMDAYLNVWEGQCRQTVEGAIYANELRKAQDDGRITSVPYDPTRPVNTFWDLGWADNTSIWFVQKVGLDYRVIDFYQNRLRDIPHYLQVLQQKPYVYGTDFLPHDARAKRLGMNKSIEETLKGLGRRVDIIPIQSILDGIHSARMIFGACWFDASKCADGLQSLRRYRYDTDPDTGRVSRLPLHDANSHAADAWRYFATAPDVMWHSHIEMQGYDRGNGMEYEYDPYSERVQ